MLTDHGNDANPPLGAEMPDGIRFIGREPGAASRWAGNDFPTDSDLSACVACGLCLPHCPTYRLTGEESASPRGRIAAMRAVSEGVAGVDATFMSFMDLCLACRACEDVCPSHVPFGRMMERARVQVEPLRSAHTRALRRVGLDVVLSRGWLLSLATMLQPLARPFLPKRIRRILPRGIPPLRRMPAISDPPTGVALRGAVALLSGCVQDRWFREVNRATVRVLTRNGWRVLVPRGQACCGALAAHNGRLETARKLARRNADAFAGAERIVVNAAGCSAHMKDYGELVEGIELPVSDLMEFLHREGIAAPPNPIPGVDRVAYHDACHALRAMHIHDEPRALLRDVPGLEVVDVVDGDRCCGAAGLYNVVQPEMSSRLMLDKARAIAATGARVVASANPGCTMQISAGLRELGYDAEVVHPVELLDRAYAGGTTRRPKPRT